MASSVDERNDMENSAIEVMRENMRYQDDPMLGIFWYDTKLNELFGVMSSMAVDSLWYDSPQFGKRVRTDRRLHESVWKKNHFRGKDRRYWGDYTKIPRGRVFEFEGEGFKVFTGKWIEDYPDAKELILEEFQLPQDTEFLQDIHWELGHGWSDELI